MVVEMAMRGLGQISHLASFSKPTIGVVTNVGYSHMDLVGSRLGVARAKGELLEALPVDGVGVLCREDEFFETLKGRSNARVTSFGFDESADCRITEYLAEGWAGCRVSGVAKGRSWVARPRAVGRHIALNVAAAVLAAFEAGVDPEEAAASIEHATIPPMRMEIRELGGATIVLDAYNASPSSMVAAIETLGSLPCKGRRLAVIGEMKELGDFSAEGHRLVGEALVQNRIDEAIFLGEETKQTFAGANGITRAMAKDIADVTHFLAELKPGDTVLIKGSRAMQLERALEPLTGALL